MSGRRDEFGSDVDFALITFAEVKYLRAYRRKTGWDSPILIDAERSAYRLFGYGRGSPWRVYGFRTLRRYAGIFWSRGFGDYRRATEDTLQLGGNVVIDADGVATWIYRGEGPDDRPTVDELLAHVERAR